MKTENNKIDFLEYELDGMNTIGILNGILKICFGLDPPFVDGLI